MRILFFCLLLSAALSARVAVADAPADALTVPAFTAYIEPNAEGADVTNQGVENWKDAAQSVNWYGMIKTPGLLTVAVGLTPAPGQSATLRLTVAGQARTMRVSGASQFVIFGNVLITAP